MASEHETIFTMEATPVKFGTGAADDAGWELKQVVELIRGWPIQSH